MVTQQKINTTPTAELAQLNVVQIMHRNSNRLRQLIKLQTTHSAANEIERIIVARRTWLKYASENYSAFCN